MIDIDDYRKQFAAGLAAPPHPALAGGNPAVMSFWALDSHTVGQQDVGPGASPQAEGNIVRDLDTLRNSAESPGHRREALARLQAAAFLGKAFNTHQLAFRDALRAIVTAPPPTDGSELQQIALEALALDADEVATDVLRKSVDDPARAIVPLAKAIQLLAHDDHGSVLPLARKVANDSADPGAREEAVRALGSDPASADTLVRVLADRSAPASLRALGASGLRMVDPARFSQEAQRIVSDPGEDDALRADCLAALVHGGPVAQLGASPFKDEVARIVGSGGDSPLVAAASRFLQARDTP